MDTYDIIRDRSRDALVSQQGNPRHIRDIQELQTFDVVSYYDDFLGDEIRGSGASPGIYEIITTTDGTLTIRADQLNGVARIIAGAATPANDEYCGVSLPELNWSGDLSACIAVRLNLDTLATAKVEIGFTDVTTDAGAVNVLADADVASDSVNAADCAVWCYDTDDTVYWQGVGAKTSACIAKLEPEHIGPTAGEFQTLMVLLRGNSAKYMSADTNGHITYESAWQTDAIEGGSPLVPWMFLQVRDAVDRYLDIDFIHVWQRRTTA